MRGHRFAVLSLAAVGTAVPWSGAIGQITTIPSATATVGGNYSTNPFLTGEGDGAGSTQLDVRTSLQLIDGVNDAVISANYNRSDYFSRYGSNDGYGATVSANKRLNPRAGLQLGVSYDSQILGNLNGFNLPALSPGLTPATGTDTGGVVSPVVTAPVIVAPVLGGVNGDVGLIGLRQRRSQISAQLSGSYALTSLSSVNLGVTGSKSLYPDSGAQLSNFKSYGLNFGYNRTVSEISSVGFQVSASKIDYDQGLSSQIYTPRLTYSRTLSELWSANASVGAGIARGDRRSTSVSLSVEGSVCRQGERGSGCLTASRVPNATGLGGVSVVTAIGLSYSRQLSEAMSMGASASYNRTGNGLIVTETGLQDGGSQQFLSSDVSLQRRISRRLSAVGSVGYRNVNGTFSNGSDVSARLGLSVAMGGR